jgi:hypothetical protein
MNIKSIRLERVETAKMASTYHDKITEKQQNIDVRLPPKTVIPGVPPDAIEVHSVIGYQRPKGYQKYPMEH